jgi:hypothetical protein
MNHRTLTQRVNVLVEQGIFEDEESLQESFGVWKDRDDIQSDSIVIVDKWRKEWDEREQRLGLA